MKKLLLFGLMLFPIMFVSAAATPRTKVLTLEATSTKATINYKGTIEEDSHAVMCKLYDSSDKQIDMLSSAVDNQKFEGSFEVTKGGKYKVACANYEGGDFETVDVTVKEIPNAKTFDAGIKGSLILLGLSSLGIAAYYVNKRKKASK